MERRDAQRPFGSAGRALLKVVPPLLFVGACFAAFCAWITLEVGCDENCDPGGAFSIWKVQLYVALSGIVPAGFALHSALRGKVQRCVAWLMLAIAIYGTWGILNEAAVRGWDHIDRSSPFALLAGVLVLLWALTIPSRMAKRPKE